MFDDVFLVGVDSTLEWSLLRNRCGDPGRFSSSESSIEGSGGNGIVGIEYSLGNACDEETEEGVLLCRLDSNLCPNNVGLVIGIESFELALEAGETPLIFDNNYKSQYPRPKNGCLPAHRDLCHV